MRNSKKICTVMVAAVLALAGCSLGPQTAPAEKKTEAAVTEEKDGGKKEVSKPRHIGLIYPTLSSEFLSRQSAELKGLLEENGCKVELVSSDDDSAKELQQLENFANMGVDTVMIFPIGATAAEVGNTLQKLRDQGIRVVVVGNQVTLGTFDIMSRIDQERLGKNEAQLAADWIDQTFPNAADGSVEVAIIETTTSPDSKTCSEALHSVEELTSKAKIVEVYNHPFGEPITKVQESLDIMLSNHPDIKVVLTYSEIQSMAVDETIMGKNGIDKASFAVFSNGFSAATAKKIKDSENNTSVIRGSLSYGAVSEMVDVIFGNVEGNENHVFFGEIDAITPENVDDYLK